MSQTAPASSDDRRRKYAAGALAGVVIAGGIAAVLVAFAKVDVCDQELAQSGRVVEVCRHLQVTDPPIVAAGLVILAALGAFFTEVGAFGVSLKRDVRDAKAAATNAVDAARSAESASASAAEAAAAAELTAAHAREVSAQAQQVAEYASGAAQSATSAAQVAGQLAQQAFGPAQASRQPTAAGLEEEIRALAEEYSAVRDDMRRGSARTTRMTSIVAKMIALFADRGADEVDVSGLLASDDRGLRLAAYCYLYAHPQPVRTPELAGAVIEEDKPFGQYWGLRALRQQVAADPRMLDLNTKRRLEQLLENLGPATDRAHEVRAMLDVMSGGPD